MLAKVISASLKGINGVKVRVEVDLSRGLPSFDIVGLPDTAVRESRERVRAGIKNSGYEFPIKKIIINLAPAALKKGGPHFDLPIALGILAAIQIVPQTSLEEYMVIGELSLTGKVRPVNGVLPMVVKAREEGLKGVIVPASNVPEASLIGGLKVIGVYNLQDVINYFKTGHKPNLTINKKNERKFEKQYNIDFSEVKGQQEAKRALEIAAAGGHNVLMIGPPGTGKSMIARRITTILPPLDKKSALELTKIYSVQGLNSNKYGLISRRPFRSPHHSISTAGLIGGGRIPEPGEVSLAHHGVLFLDELAEYRRDVLEVLRQPLEEGKVTIVRSSMSATFPARFMLVAAMNPCPCGYYGDTRHECRCTTPQINRYRSKVSGPLMDRIDIHVEVPNLSVDEITGESKGEPSARIRERVNSAYKIQIERYKQESFSLNSQLKGKHLKKYCHIGSTGRDLLNKAIDSLGLSARGYDRILKLSRTIADLSGSIDIKREHIAEAIQYRTLDRKLY
ncbi:YifB family Mg chelatase-like AAA ATPase [Halothermothrix orenii]|uniref:Mg chelatase, subunit ChlI n=1 Tax=Halothermothrix orenii (strain H 168 / OCM 544 / DSM 9562) TaxID=373903 RepID=B8CW29_HALOH|nr:YifB family Mg chelatase-like AAA ATPase [Halothermothrix orenii]ACL69498.1 Mg chelatase, subunit ChlI [Halothermothrix orenii H 168]